MYSKYGDKSKQFKTIIYSKIIIVIYILLLFIIPTLNNLGIMKKKKFNLNSTILRSMRT